MTLIRRFDGLKLAMRAAERPVERVVRLVQPLVHFRIAVREVRLVRGDDRRAGRGGVGAPHDRSTRVEIDLIEKDGATLLRLVHHGLPPKTVEDHERGWSYFLGVLRDFLSRGPDDLRP